VPVSNLFKQNIYATERKIQAKVSFEILDVTAYDDVTVTASTESGISRLEQVTNKNREMSQKYGTFEDNYWQLDGSFVLPPHENEGDSELGWWSGNLSGADKIFVTRPYLTFSFTEPHSSIGLTITFDKNTNEYATSFRIETYDENGALDVSELISGNTSPIYYFNRPLDNYTRIVITIISWAKAYRRARITEVDFGSVQEYTGDKLINLKVIEEMDLLASTIPSNEMSFELDNSDQYFNILNPNGVYKYLVPNQEMYAQLGLLIGEQKYEWIPMGKFYMSEWTVEEGAMTATFTGHDLFTQLDLIDVQPTVMAANATLYDLAEDVLTQAKVEKYILDDSLKEISTTGFTDVKKAREALQLIAIAGMCVCRQDRNGAILMEHYEELKYETGYITWTGTASGTVAATGEFAGIDTYPQVYVDYMFQQISFDNAYEIPKITLGSQVKQINMTIHPANGLDPYEIQYMNSQVKDGIGYAIDNVLITTEERAAEIAAWMFTYYNFIASYQASWRQNPALECGNIVLIEDRFGNKKKARITKQEFDFEGYLLGTTEAKGGV
jgi:hypothetical protein